MWLQEDKIISQICKFLENKNIFNVENLTKNILRLKKNAKNVSEKKDYFSLIIKKGLIFPKNFKAKFSIWDFFENLFFHPSFSHFLKNFRSIADFRFPVISMPHYLQSKLQYDKKLLLGDSQSPSC